MFKYVSPDRLDVLKNSKIRFTPPLNTNDIFEVRQTFKLLVGPKYSQLFQQKLDSVDFEKEFRDQLNNTSLSGFSADEVKQVFAEFYGVDLLAYLKEISQNALNNLVIPKMNSQQSIDKFITEFAEKQILLSLSESPFITPMWAHYASNSTGFVIEFDTDNIFFKRGENKEREGLQKVHYFNNKIDEIIENPFAALISKQSDWSYEREWRLYLKNDEAKEIKKIGDELIHLISFPRSAIKSIIIGLRTEDSVISEIRRILYAYYSDVVLSKIIIDNSEAKLRCEII